MGVRGMCGRVAWCRRVEDVGGSVRRVEAKEEGWHACGEGRVRGPERRAGGEGWRGGLEGRGSPHGVSGKGGQTGESRQSAACARREG